MYAAVKVSPITSRSISRSSTRSSRFFTVRRNLSRLAPLYKVVSSAPRRTTKVKPYGLKEDLKPQLRLKLTQKRKDPTKKIMKARMTTHKTTIIEIIATAEVAAPPIDSRSAPRPYRLPSPSPPSPTFASLPSARTSSSVSSSAF